MSNHRNLKDLFPQKFNYIKSKVVIYCINYARNKVKQQNKLINHL